MKIEKIRTHQEAKYLNKRSAQKKDKRQENKMV